MARTTIKSHKKATDLNLTAELGDLLGLQTGSDSMKLKSADDLSEPNEKVEKNTVAAVEATINYVNKLLNESDEELPEDPEDEVDDEDPSLDDVEDEDEDLGDDEDDDLDDDEDDDMEECDGPKKFFSEDDESIGDEEDGEDFDDDEDEEDDDEELGDMEDEDMGDDDFEDGEEDLDDEDSEDDELDGEPTDDELDDGEDMDDVTEGYRGLFEDDESMGDDSDPEDMEDDSDSDGLSIDIPEDMDPNDVSVSVGGSEYVPDTSDDEDLGDLDDDELAGEEDEEEEDTPVQEGYYPFLEEYFTLGEDDDPDIDDADPEYDDSEFDDDEDSDEEDLDDEDLGDEEPEEEVTESAVMRALRRLIKEGDVGTSDPSNSTGDAPIDSEEDIDDSEAEEKDLSGSEGEVTDSDIPIEKGTIQPEEAAELRWMARKLKSIMEGDDLDSHSDGDGKLSAEPLDDDASDMIGNINDNLSDDGELTDTGNGAVDDSDSTLGTPDEADDDVEVEGDDVVSSNGEKYDTEEDEDEMLTDNYHMLMTAIREAYAKKKGKKKDKKVALKKVDKKAKAKKGKKKLSEGNLNDVNFGVSNDKTYNAGSNPADATNVKGYGAAQDGTNKPMNTLETTTLGSFNAQEMTSVLRNLNNAFGAGKVAKEVRDSSVVSEVSVPKWSLPIAENASWDGLKASKLLIETAYKSESKVNTDLLKKTHLYWEGTGSKESDYKFPIASMVEGQAQIIPQAIDEATTLFASPSFISRFSESALKKIRNVLDFYNEKMGKKSPWKENKQINVTEAAKITMIDRTQYNPLAVLKRLSEQEKAKKLINLRG